MQQVEPQRLNLLSNEKTGRPIDEERLATLTQILEQTFPKFERRLDDAEERQRAPAPSGATTSGL